MELEGSGGQTYKLKFGTNAICKIEDKYDKSIGDVLEVLSDPKKIRMSTLRALVQVSLEGTPDDDEVGDLIDDVGVAKIAAAFNDMLSIDGKDEVKVDATPQNAGELTGVATS